MFNLTMLTTSIVIFYSYGNLTDITNNVFIGLFTLITLLNFIFYYIYPPYFLRFHFSFNPEPLKFNHYFLHILNIILSIIFMGILTDYPWVPFIPQAFLLLYTLIVKPYNYRTENYRSAFNMFIMCVITSMRVFFFYASDKIINSENSNIYPMVIEGLLLLGIIWAYYSVLKDIICEYILHKNNKNIPYDLYEEEETIRKLQKEILDSNKFRNSTVLKSLLPKNYESTESYREKSKYIPSKMFMKKKKL